MDGKKNVEIEQCKSTSTFSSKREVSQVNQEGEEYSKKPLFSESQVLELALEGMVLANSGLVWIRGLNIILRRDYMLRNNMNKVRLLSGGWSGFEPMYTGFVGQGMLTAVVLGEKAVVPACPAILTAIRELGKDHQPGVLIIVMNRPIIKLNFSLAVECATREEINVKVVFVADDTSGVAPGSGRRGLCGIAFLFKVAGAMVELGKPLEEIFRVCSELSTTDVASINVSVRLDEKQECNYSIESESVEMVDSTSSCEEYVEKTLEIQCEMIGVPAVCHSFNSLQDMARKLLGYIIDASLSPYSMVVEPDTPVALLLNNFGFIMNLEMHVVVSEVVKQMKSRGISVARVYVGSVMTDPYYKGFCISVMKITESDWLKYLDFPTDVSSWPRDVRLENITAEKIPLETAPRFPCVEEQPPELGPILSEEDDRKVNTVVDYVAMALSNCEGQINKIGANNNLPTYGTIIKICAENIRTRLSSGKLNTDRPFQLLQQLAYICSFMPSVCGVHYSIFFEAASHPFTLYLYDVKVNYNMWIEALQSGIDALEFFTKLKRGDRNLLDALYPALEEMKKNPESYTKIAEAAETGTFNTVGKNKKHNYIPDVGSHTVAIWIRAIVEAMNAVESGRYPIVFTSYDDSEISYSPMGFA